MHQLTARPFLGQYLLLRPGHAKGVAIPESRLEELRKAATGGPSAPLWLADAITAAWQIPMPTGPLRDTLLVHERSTYGAPQFAAAYEYATGLGIMIQVSTNGSQLHKANMRELFARLRP